MWSKHSVCHSGYYFLLKVAFVEEISQKTKRNFLNIINSLLKIMILKAALKFLKRCNNAKSHMCLDLQTLKLGYTISHLI